MKVSAVALAALLVLSGCASIFNGSSQPVTIQTVPEGATVSVTNGAGEKVHSGTAPLTVTLKRGAGYFKSETYTVEFAKPGFATRQMTITGTMSGWYVANILFGGLIGMLAVDPVTGAMYNLPDNVSGTLEAEAPQTSRAPDRLTIVSTDALSPAQMAQARLLVAAR